MPCAHCGLANHFGQTTDKGRRRTFCTIACRMRAYRRRKQGLPEDAFPYGGQHGQLTLREAFDRALLAEAVGELEAARQVFVLGEYGWFQVRLARMPDWFE